MHISNGYRISGAIRVEEAKLRVIRRVRVGQSHRNGKEIANRIKRDRHPRNSVALLGARISQSLSSEQNAHVRTLGSHTDKLDRAGDAGSCISSDIPWST